MGGDVLYATDSSRAPVEAAPKRRTLHRSWDEIEDAIDELYRMYQEAQDHPLMVVPAADARAEGSLTGLGPDWAGEFMRIERWKRIDAAARELVDHIDRIEGGGGLWILAGDVLALREALNS